MEFDLKLLTDETFLSQDDDWGINYTFEQKAVLASAISKMKACTLGSFIRIEYNQNVIDIPSNWIKPKSFITLSNDTHFFCNIFSTLLNVPLRGLYVDRNGASLVIYFFDKEVDWTVNLAPKESPQELNYLKAS